MESAVAAFLANEAQDQFQPQASHALLPRKSSEIFFTRTQDENLSFDQKDGEEEGALVLPAKPITFLKTETYFITNDNDRWK